jgi:hypothetical protein
MFLGESLVLGVVGSSIGIVVGVVLGHALMAYMANTVEQTYGVRVQVDCSSERGSLMMDRKVYKRLWNDGRVDIFDVMLEKGYDPEKARTEIQRHFADRHNLFVLTNENYEYTLLGEEMFACQPVYKIKAVYKDRANTQYSQLQLWVRKDIVAVTFVEFHAEGKLSKTLRWDEWKQIQSIWTPHLIEMKDLVRGSMTRIHSSNVKYNVKLEPDWFSLRNLRRVP